MPVALAGAESVEPPVGLSLGGAGSVEGGVGEEDGGVVGSEGGVVGSDGGVLGSEGEVLGFDGGVLGSEGGVLGSDGGVLGSDGGAVGCPGGLPPLGQARYGLIVGDGFHRGCGADGRCRPSAREWALAGVSCRKGRPDVTGRVDTMPVDGSVVADTTRRSGPGKASALGGAIR